MLCHRLVLVSCSVNLTGKWDIQCRFIICGDDSKQNSIHTAIKPPGAIAWLVGMSLGNQEAPQSILASGTSFREDLVMKIFLRQFFLFR